MPTKVILDTDIGTDVDDAWALAICLASERIELLGVTLVHADLDTRAKITLKMLKLAGRTDVPVYNGLSRTLTPGDKYIWQGHEGTDTDFSDIEGLSSREDAVDFILETVERYPGEVVLCPIGPLTNIAEAIKRDPEVMRKVKKLAIMGTTFTGEGPEEASLEHNSSVDPVATRIVIESGIPATIVGLNVTMQVAVRRDDVAKMRTSGFGNYLADMTDQYFCLCGRDLTYMHDPLAVATLIDPSVVTTRKMTGKVLDDGRVVWQSAPSNALGLDVSVDVDAGGFEKLLLENIYKLTNKGE